MSIALKDVISSARNRSPFFHKNRGTGDKAIGDYLGDLQTELIAKGTLRDKQFMAQRATIVVNTNAGDLPETVGAGTDTGLPGAIDDTVDPPRLMQVLTAAGDLVQVALSADDGATVVMAPLPVSASSSTSATSAAATRTVNGDAGAVLYITEGTGAGQARYILSNTATMWVISTGNDGLEWTTPPDTTSLVSVVQPAYVVDGSAGVVNELPATRTRGGYLVRLAADGTPFIDLTAPLVATIEDGVTIPSAHGVTAAQLRLTDGDVVPVELVSYMRRIDKMWRLEFTGRALYIEGNTVYLCGDADDWDDVVSIDIVYAPIAPPLTDLTDLFLLPDSARPLLVARATEFLAIRTRGQPGTTIDDQTIALHSSKADKAEADWLASLRIGKRARVTTFRETA